MARAWFRDVDEKGKLRGLGTGLIVLGLLLRQGITDLIFSQESCSVTNMEGEGEGAASVGPTWQREKGWGPAVSNRKEGGEGVRAPGPRKKLGRMGSLAGPRPKVHQVSLLLFFFSFFLFFLFQNSFPNRILCANKF